MGRNSIPILSEVASQLQVVSGVDTTLEPAALALNAEAAQMWGNPQWHFEQAQLITETLNKMPDAALENIFSGIVRTHSVGETDSVLFEEYDGIRSHWIAEGGQVPETGLAGRAFTVPRDDLAMAVSEFDATIRTNYAQTLQRLMAYAPNSMRARIYRRLTDIFRAAITTGNPNYSTITNANWIVPANAQTTISNLIGAVADAPVFGSESFQSQITIIGRRSTLQPLYSLPSFSNSMKDEAARTGKVGQVLGASIVELPPLQNAAGVAEYPTGELWVISRQAGLIVSYGGVRAESWRRADIAKSWMNVRRTVGVSGHGLDRGTVKRLVVTA